MNAGREGRTEGGREQSYLSLCRDQCYRHPWALGPAGSGAATRCGFIAIDRAGPGEQPPGDSIPRLDFRSGTKAPISCAQREAGG